MGPDNQDLNSDASHGYIKITSQDIRSELARRRGAPKSNDDLTKTTTVILDVYRSFGSPVENPEIYGQFGVLEEGKKVILPSDFFRETEHSGRLAYVHSVRATISDLRRGGYLEQVDRGVYVIAPKGVEELKGIEPDAIWIHIKAVEEAL